jgi:dihydroneopterin aldolase
MSKIALKGMQFHSFHGYYTEEQSVGNQYEVDVIVDVSMKPEMLSDTLENTINYEDIYQVCKQQMAHSQRLIETVAHNILTALKDQVDRHATYTVEIRKLNPLMGGLVDHALFEVTG